MIAVADSSPLIILAKLDCFNLLNKLYSRLYISAEVYDEVVVAGEGLPGAREVAASDWIEVRRLQDHAALLAAQTKYVLGVGELSTILLGKEIQTDVAILDDFKARDLAKREGIQIRGTVGILETLYRKGYLADLRAAFQQLLVQSVYIDRRLLNRRLQSFDLPPL